MQVKVALSRGPWIRLCLQQSLDWGSCPLSKPVLRPLISSLSPHYLPVSPFWLRMARDGPGDLQPRILTDTRSYIGPQPRRFLPGKPLLNAENVLVQPLLPRPRNERSRQTQLAGLLPGSGIARPISGSMPPWGSRPLSPTIHHRARVRLPSPVCVLLASRGS